MVKSKMFMFKAIMIMTFLMLSEMTSPAWAGEWDVNQEENVPPHTTNNCKITFTKDGDIIGSHVCQLVNDTDKVLKRTCTAKAPKGTNDRNYEGEWTPLTLKAGSWLPPSQIDDYGDFLSVKGFNCLTSALASPMVLGDDNHNGILDAGDVSIFASIHDVGVFATVANQSNFPLGSTLQTDQNGQVSGLPGITFYLDESHTTRYANKQLIVQGINYEYSKTEPIPTLSEWGLIVMAVLLVAAGAIVIVRRRRRVAA